MHLDTGDASYSPAIQAVYRPHAPFADILLHGTFLLTILLAMEINKYLMSSSKGGTGMKPYSVTALVTLAIFAAYWAYTIGDTLIHEFDIALTFIDVGALFALGFISGIALGLVPRFKIGHKI